VAQWHSGLKIAFGYVSSHMDWYDPDNHKGAELQEMVADCVRKM